jgi:hypothetical protein
MRLPRLTFTLYRDPKGYRIEGTVPEPPRSKPPRRRQQRLPLMTCGRLGKPEGSGPWISGYIVRTSDKTEAVQLDRYPEAYTEFAAVEYPTELLEFISKYGPLTKAKRQVIFTLLAEARQLRNCMGAKKGIAFLANIVGLEASLIRGETGTLEAYLVPSSLLDALWLQFHYSQSSGATFRNCPYCNVTFAAGGNSGRLRNAEFCSPEHRKRYNSLARSNPKMRKMRERHK